MYSAERESARRELSFYFNAIPLFRRARYFDECTAVCVRVAFDVNLIVARAAGTDALFPRICIREMEDERNDDDEVAS